jgi:3-oxoacyl-[acyl-carrier-protein] synthase II
VKVGAEVKDFDPTGLASPKELRKLARYTQFSLAAAKEAVEDADLVGAYPNERIGVVFGSAVGDIGCIAQQEQTLLERGPSRVAPWFIPSVLTDAASGQLAISFGFSGINFAMVAACATGSYTLGEGAEIVRRGAADAILAGGAEAALTPLILAGFSNMRGLAGEQENPAHASRPFDATRDGFVIGEGAGILVLEELEAARARGAKIHAEVVSYGASNDAYHVAQPDPEAGGVARMMTEALAAGGIEPEQVGYINAHGTSTPLGDAAETRAIKAAFGDHAYKLAVSSTKSMLGHCLGAAGALEAIACVLAIEHGIIPPTINYEHPDPECDLDYVPNVARKADLSYALSNGMGLGGHNGCVLLGRVD